MASTISIWKYSNSYPTDTSMRVSVMVTAGYGGSYRVRFKLYRDGVTDPIRDEFGSEFDLAAGETIGEDGSFYKTFTGLRAGTGYTLEAILWDFDAGYELDVEDELSFTTTGSFTPDESDKPSKWSWKTPGITKRGDMDYTQSGTTITPTPLTANEWLLFIERIEEVYEWLGEEIDEDDVIAATNGVRSGQPMTANQANGARLLIRDLDPPDGCPSRVYSGDTITADFINGLKDALNDVIDNY